MLCEGRNDLPEHLDTRVVLLVFSYSIIDRGRGKKGGRGEREREGTRMSTRKSCEHKKFFEKMIIIYLNMPHVSSGH